MKILTLSIRQRYFDEILAGEKKTETREIRLKNFGKYCRYRHKGKESIEDIWPDEDDVDVVPVKYDAIKFLTGEYKGKRPWALVEVTGAEIFTVTNDNDEPIMYEVDGKEYVAADIDYHLGKVIDRG